jgi:tetraacyldisaccharide 4'-kinase
MPQRPLLFCGIARPQDFATGLRTQGCNPVAEVFFCDHQKYSQHEIARLLKEAGKSNADGFITTEKDAVKLSAAMREQLNPLIIAELHLELSEAGACMDALMQRLATGIA